MTWRFSSTGDGTHLYIHIGDSTYHFEGTSASLELNRIMSLNGCHVDNWETWPTWGLWKASGVVH